MPTLILNDVPQSLLDNLQRRAPAGQSSVPEFTLSRLQLVLESDQMPRMPDPWLPELIPHEEISPPFDLPFATLGVLVQAVPGKAPLPDISDLPAEVQ